MLYNSLSLEYQADSSLLGTVGYLSIIYQSTRVTGIHHDGYVSNLDRESHNSYPDLDDRAIDPGITADANVPVTRFTELLAGGAQNYSGGKTAWCPYVAQYKFAGRHGR